MIISKNRVKLITITITILAILSILGSVSAVDFITNDTPLSIDINDVSIGIQSNDEDATNLAETNELELTKNNENTTNSIESSENTTNSLKNNENTTNSLKISENTTNSIESSVNDSNLVNSKQYNTLSSTSSSDIYVSTTGSDSTGDGTSKNPYQSIKYAIANSVDGSKIHIASGNYVGENNRNITIGKNISIIGNSRENTIIDGEKIARIFIINSTVKVTISNLTLTNGHEDTKTIILNGGAIYTSGANLTIINTTIKNSYGNSNGGAIYNIKSALTLINCDFINNTASSYGGALYTAGITYIDHCNFSKNNVSNELAGVGGAMFIAGYGYINNTIFENNTSEYSVGGICNSGNITINNCTFINQSTRYAGGGISNHNTAIINNSYFIGNYAGFYAGAILAITSSKSITEVYNTIFNENHAGMFSAVENAYSNCYLTFEKCSISGNYIQINKMYGDLLADENISAQYCWWGSNQISPYYVCEGSKGIINASKWLVMNLTSNNSKVYAGDDNTFTVSIKQYFDNDTKKIYNYNEDINLPLTVKFYTNAETIDTVELVNGTATINFNPNTYVSAIYATIDNQTLKIDVKPRARTKLATNNLSDYYSSSKSMNVKLTDYKNNPLANKTIMITINSKTYTKTTDEDGNIELKINLAVGRYKASIKFSGDEDYIKSSNIVNVNILNDETSSNSNNQNTNADDSGNGNGTGKGIGNGTGDGSGNGTGEGNSNFGNGTGSYLGSSQSQSNSQTIAGSASSIIPSNAGESEAGGSSGDDAFEINKTQSNVQKSTNNYFLAIIICTIALLLFILGYRRQKDDETQEK